jgi:hypothetical protein
MSESDHVLDRAEANRLDRPDQPRDEAGRFSSPNAAPEVGREAEIHEAGFRTLDDVRKDDKADKTYGSDDHSLKQAFDDMKARGHYNRLLTGEEAEKAQREKYVDAWRDSVPQPESVADRRTVGTMGRSLASDDDGGLSSPDAKAEGEAMTQFRIAPRQIVNQAVITGGSAAVTSPAFSAQTRYIRLGASGGAVTDRVNYIISQPGVSTVATAYSTLPSGSIEFVAVSPGQQAVVMPSAGAVVVTITEVE